MKKIKRLSIRKRHLQDVLNGRLSLVEQSMGKRSTIRLIATKPEEHNIYLEYETL